MKKFLLVLGMAACIFGMSVFGQTPVYAAHSSEAITEEEAMSNAVGFAEQMNEIVATGMVEQYLGYDPLFSSLTSWQSALEVIGDYQGILSAEGSISDDIVTINAVVDGTVKDADMTIVIDAAAGALVGITTEPQKTFGELMTNAALNTLLGMGTVFIVLILIAGLISLFKFIPSFMEKFSGKKTEAPKPAPAPVAAAPAVEEAAEVDDLELIAVIAAAIAASEDAASTDGFVVRSVKRRGTKWQKA